MDSNLPLIKKEIEKLAKDPGVSAVILAGSAAVADDLSSCKDIDIFVILSAGESLEREVIEKENIIWDITYLPQRLLKQGIKEKWPFLIHGLKNNKPLFIGSGEINLELARIQEIYQKGPGVLTEEEIKYIRFKLTQDYEDLLKRKNDLVNGRFLAQNLLREIFSAYFRLNNQWEPRAKKLLAELKLKNPDLYNLALNFLAEKNMEKNLVQLKDMIKYVLNPFGGRLKYWPKGKFPLK